VLGPASTGLLAFWLLTPPDAATQWIGLLVIAAGAVLAALAGGRVTRPPGPADP
jgi:drug/metabolite transporter (DMT)-like permease